MRVGTSDLVTSIVASLSVAGLARPVAAVKTALRYLSEHTGVPALALAAILLCVGYRVLKRTARFLLEVVAVALLLFAATELGWLRW